MIYPNEMVAAAPSRKTQGISFSITLQVFPSAFWQSDDSKKLDLSDKAVLPETVLQRLLNNYHSRRMPQPIVFEIQDQRAQKQDKPMIHCGVVEFTATPGQAYLPTWMFDFLRTKDGDPVKEGANMRFRMRTLEKATYAKFKPLDPEFGTLPTPRATLENMMHGLTTITEGQTLPLTYKNKIYELQVLEVKPGPAGQLINTNVTVEFEMDGMDLKEDREQPPDQLRAGDGTGFSVEKDEYGFFMIKLADPEKGVKFTMKVETGDPEFFIHTKEQRPTRARHFWTSVDRQKKSLTILPSDPNFPSSWFYLGVLGYGSAAEGEIVTESVDPERTPSPRKGLCPPVEPIPPKENELTCPNCKRNISKANFMMHEMRCARANWCCPTCLRVVPKSQKDKHIHCPKEDCDMVFESQAQLDKHDELVHALLTCPKCGVEVSSMEHHLEKACPKRNVKCHWCGMLVALDEKESHETECGARTIPCDICQKYVQRQHMESHKFAAHGINPLLDEFGRIRKRRVNADGQFEFVEPSGDAPAVDALTRALEASRLDYEKHQLKEMGLPSPTHAEDEKKEPPPPKKPFIAPVATQEAELNLDDWDDDGEDESMGWSDDEDGNPSPKRSAADKPSSPALDDPPEPVDPITRPSVVEEMAFLETALKRDCPYCLKPYPDNVLVPDHLIDCEKNLKSKLLATA